MDLTEFYQPTVDILISVDSVGNATALSWTVVFMLTLLIDDSLNAPQHFAASMVSVNNHSHSSSPMRFRQRVNEVGFMGGSFWKNLSPQK